MEYRLNFVLAAANSMLTLAGAIFGLHLLFRSTGRLGGWTWDQALLVAGIFTLLEGITAGVLSPNLGRIVDHVRKGTLDFVLLKPIDSQFWISLRQVSVWGFPNVLLGALVVAYAAWRLRLPPAALVRAVLPLLLGIVILYGLWFLLASTCIWFVKIHNVTALLRNCLEAGRFPVSAFPRTYRFLLTFVLPVAFLTTVPAQAILGHGRTRDLASAAVLALCFSLLSRRFWLFSLRYYSSASS
ncbi:MAG: ABC-2 family transporter protein [Lentisphaeria bacterium]|nr:ABC-2 family transporter protein [Lentisphaeria bacterium]